MCVVVDGIALERGYASGDETRPFELTWGGGAGELRSERPGDLLEAGSAGSRVVGRILWGVAAEKLGRTIWWPGLRAARRPAAGDTVPAMRFAFKTAPQNTTWADMLAVWQAADDIELFESGWTFDHFYPIFSDSTGPCLEGWTTTTALAQATTRLRVGLLVTGIHYRHPAVLANMAAALDVISGGRLELGVGAGWNEEESTAYGIELGSLTERFDRFDEALEVLVSLLTNETTTFAGEHYTLTDARNEPKPVQRPHPPIVIGGTGPKRTLRSAARWAQHWNHPGATVENWKASRDVLYAHCADLGRDPAEITLSTHLRYDADAGVGALAEQAAAYAEAGLDLGIVYLPPPHRPAVLEPVAEALAPLAAN